MNWVADKNASINITASRMDTEASDFATAGFGNCITRDGQGGPTANLPMGTFRHTGVGDGSARTDYTSVGQTQDGKLNWVTAGGGADTLAATYVPALTTLVDGQLCFARAVAANATTTPTFAPNGLTAHTITKVGGAALAVNDIQGTGHELILRYKLSTTNWELLNPSAPVVYSNDAGAAVGPSLDIFRDSASPAVSDFIGSVDFNGRDSGAAKQLYAQIAAQITDPTAASEDSIVILRALIAGTLTDVLKSSAAGIVIPGSLAVTGAITSAQTQPTTQRLLSGTGATFTPTAGAVRWRVTIVAPGAGGGAQATNAGGAASGVSSFQVNSTGTAWTAVQGSAGPIGSSNAAGGAGGTGGTDGSAGNLILRRPGSRGGPSHSSALGQNLGMGGASALFANMKTQSVTGNAGAAAPANSGCGGPGGGTAAGAWGGGAGGGETVEFWVTGMTTATYTIGTKGTGGAAGTIAGGDGADGIIIVEEFYS